MLKFLDRLISGIAEGVGAYIALWLLSYIFGIPLIIQFGH